MKKKEIEILKAELNLAKAFHNEKCAEFDNLCYDYCKLKAENEELKASLVEYEKPIDKFIKARETKAVKEFAEKLKLKAFPEDGCGFDCVYVNDIDELLKEVKQ